MRDSLDVRKASKFQRTLRVLERGLESHVASAIYAGFSYPHTTSSSRERTSYSLHLGKTSFEAEAQALTPSTRFDVASLTKVMATAALTAKLIERRWLDWETPISKFFPDAGHLEGIQVKHLLSHTAGFPAWIPFYEKREFSGSTAFRQNLMRELVLAVKPERPPGQLEVYSDLSFLILGFLLENLVQKSFRDACETYVFEPLGLRGTSFGPIPPRAAVATERHPVRGLIQGEVHDDNCWVMGGYAGHAGIFSTGEDVLAFGESLFGDFFSPDTLRHFWLKPYFTRTFGWDGVSVEGSSVGRYFSRHSIGHLGFTGTSLWIDPEASLVAVLLTNRVHPSRENSQIKDFRIAFHEGLREDLAHGGV